MTLDAPASESGSLSSLVNRIAGLLAHGGRVLTTGDVASLRRMDPRAAQAAFFKVEGLVLEEQFSGSTNVRDEMETRWAAIIVGLAHLGALHRPGVQLGGALVDAGFSELRFARLLRADADRLVDELPMLGRFLAAKSVSADWADAAFLMLSSGRGDEETVRRRIARRYYGALSSKNNN
jgi:CRISPR system Cascade subunit CasB